MNSTDVIPSYPSQANETAFLLGGVGTGNVSLGALGYLRDWEISNSPINGNKLPNTFFAIRMQPGNDKPVGRVIEDPVQAPPCALTRLSSDLQRWTAWKHRHSRIPSRHSGQPASPGAHSLNLARVRQVNGTIASLC